MKNKFLVVPLLAITFLFSWSYSAQTNEPQKPFDYFKTQIQSWTMENANKLATSIDDNIVLKENDLYCDSSGMGWFCYVSHLMGTGNHANYKIEIHNSNGSSYGREFSLYLTHLQLYDRYGDYSECEYQWKVEYPDDEEASFYIFNNDTGKFLQESIVKLPSIEFEAFKSPGKCK